MHLVRCVHTERKSDKHRLKRRVQLLNKSDKKSGKNDRLPVQLAQDIAGEVAEILSCLHFLSSNELVVGSVESADDALDVLDDGSGSGLLLALIRVCWDGIGDLGCG